MIASHDMDVRDVRAFSFSKPACRPVGPDTPTERTGANSDAKMLAGQDNERIAKGQRLRCVAPVQRPREHGGESGIRYRVTHEPQRLI